MRKRRREMRQTIWEHGLWYLLLSLPIGVGLLVVFLGLGALLLVVADAKDWMITGLAGGILLMVGYGMGRFAGFHRRRKGLKTGLFCGLALYVVMFLVGIAWQKNMGGMVHPLLLLFGSGWGGVSGVNAQHRRPPK